MCRKIFHKPSGSLCQQNLLPKSDCIFCQMQIFFTPGKAILAISHIGMTDSSVITRMLKISKSLMTYRKREFL